MGWIIDKQIEFAYGHRVWTQSLNGEYAADLKCACRHLHGHEGAVRVFLTGDGLDNTGMVTDFRHLEWLKKWINENVDHQFVLDRNDPLYSQMIGDRELVAVYVPGTSTVAGWKLDISDLDPETPEYEYYEGFMIVDFVPTSERLSEWLAHLVNDKMQKLGVRVQRVEWSETPKSRAVYHLEHA